jgi:hypothetical protein
VKELGLAYTVVMQLLRNFMHSYHHVYMDNFFTSVGLADDLKSADTYVCGTVRKNRKGLPKGCDKAKLKQYDSVKYVSEHNPDMLFVRWKDKRDVYMLSTNNNGENTVKTRTPFRVDELVTIPTVVAKYNKSMGGVDHLDQLRSYYTVGRTGRKWWKYLFWGMLNIAIVNGYILWYYSTMPHQRNKRLYSLKAFKMLLIHEWADGYTTRKRNVESFADKQRKIKCILHRNAKPSHRLVEFSGRKRHCTVCKKEGRQTRGQNPIETIYGCSGCMVNMCKGCFYEHHQLLAPQ